MTVCTLRQHVFLLLAAFTLLTLPAFGQSDTTAPMPGTTTPTTLEQPDLVKQYQATITPEDLAAHLYLFASDYFEGRETSTRGQKLAAAYLASEYRHMGLMPKGNQKMMDNPYAPEAYFQKFPLYGRRLAKAELTVMKDGKQVGQSMFSADKHDGNAYLAFGNLPEASGEVVFAGYGIQDDELGYNDYAAMQEKGIDLAGKWMIVLRDEPLASAEASLLKTEDGTPSRWTTQTFDKLRTAFSSGGPAGILVVGDIGPRGKDVAEGAMKQAMNLKNDVGNLSLTEQGPSRPFPSIYMISSEMANMILAPSGKTVAALQQQINTSIKPEVFAVPGMMVKSTIEHESFETSSENVAAFIEGSDPNLKDEVVVLSSHYDHIGINSLAEGDQINNGADDDGSGTVATLEMAQAFMQAKKDGFGPRRSILFLNVAGEEKGLLGSAYYTDTEPLVPLENIVTDLNIDMIGRYDPTHPTKSENYVYIIGSHLISQELHDLNLKVNDVTGTALELDERFNSKDDPNQFYRRSDHWNFGKNNIPFIFFFTGTHEDYHGVGDEPQKIEYDRMARITQLIFATAWQVANQDAPPAVTGEGFN